MSAPFVYSPQAEYFPAAPWANPYSSYPTVYPSSPYQGPILSDIASPTAPFSAWDTTRRRRRMSWHGTSAPTISPFIPPLPASPIPEPLARRRSWGHGEAAAWYTPAPVVPPYPTTPFAAPSSYVPGYPQFPTTLHIHPLLNGETHNEIVFDLSLTAFAPHRRWTTSDLLVPLTAADFQQPAFYPPVTRLRITCDMIPNWPIDIIYPAGMPAPPISLGDVLVTVHKTLHQPITHQDWDRLSAAQKVAVSREFTRRCKHDAGLRQNGGYSGLDVPARRQGVKVVDFLLGRSMFKGLSRSADGSVKMVVSDAWDV